MSDIATQVTRVGRSAGFKFFLIGILILMLLVPLLMVAGLVSERESRAQEVRDEVARTWGRAQAITGPFLIVPYMLRYETREGDKKVEQLVERRAVFLPDTVAIDGRSTSKVLERSIFEVPVYTTGLKIEARFAAPDITTVDPNAVSVRWRDAVLALGVTDVAGLKEATTLAVEGAEALPFAPSLGLPGQSANGIHARLAGAPSIFAADGSALNGFGVKLDLRFTGSTSLTFAPAARETRVALSSDWPHPSFSGAFLPVERKVEDSGFTASWLVPHLARSVPNSWSLADAGVERFQPYVFGVTFFQPVDFYDLVMRAVKYAVLFLGIAFMAVLVLELTAGERVHPVQYLFVGLAMVFFYVLLLSLSEHVGFAVAYIAASAATGGMLATYVGKVMQSARAGAAMLALFAVLYAFLYLVLTLEDYALLAGAILGFVALTAVMFATINVDWSSATADRDRARPLAA